MKKSLLIVASCLLAALTLSSDSLAQPSARGTGSRGQPPTASPGPSSTSSKPSSQPAGVNAGVVNLNDANAEQLALLPGVGPSRAAAIVAYRKTHPFKRLEELTRVKGFGRKTFSRLRPLLSLNGPTTLRERPHVTRPAHATSTSSSS